MHLLVIGAGLTGLFSAALAAERGATVTLAARGYGSLSLQPVRLNSSRHPPPEAIAALCRFAPDLDETIVSDETFKQDGHFRLPTAVGATQNVILAPKAQTGADLVEGGSLTVGGFPGCRDFSPELICANLRRALPNNEFRPITLPLPGPVPARDLYATDLARRFDDPEYRNVVVELWKPLTKGAQTLALPAVLGLERHPEALADLTERLRPALSSNPSWLCEVPTLPPSLPGLRLQNALLARLRSWGVEIIIGSEVRGLIENGRASAHLHTPAGARPLRADAILLAAGGFLNGGLEMDVSGNVRETVFDLPVESGEGARFRLFNPKYLESQPYASLGLRTNGRQQPLIRVAAQNLFAAGSILASPDRAVAGSRMGISLETAWRALENLAIAHP